MSSAGRGRLGEIAGLFAKLGVVAFGGPAAHVAMLEDEVVERRRWVSRQHFLDLVGATNLIPGPNSTEMVMHLGYERAGLRGLLLGGSAFILPAAAITVACAWAYVAWGSLPQIEPYLRGVKPAVLAVILAAVARLGRKAIKDWRLVVLAAGVAGAALSGLPEVPVLLGGGALGMLWRRYSAAETGGAGVGAAAAWLPSREATIAAAAGTSAAGGVALWKLGLFFLKVGAVLYGSGYVLVAFLEGDLVERFGWLTRDELLDAVAIGQLTPGPLLTTATFVGYLVAGGAGAAVATVAIFLPSFVFVLLLNPIVPRLRRSVWASAFLDAVNAAAIALMAAVAVELGRAVLVGWPAWAILVAAAVASLRFGVGPAWLVVGGAAVGRILLG